MDYQDGVIAGNIPIKAFLPSPHEQGERLFLGYFDTEGNELIPEVTADTWFWHAIECGGVIVKIGWIKNCRRCSRFMNSPLLEQQKEPDLRSFYCG